MNYLLSAALVLLSAASQAQELPDRLTAGDLLEFAKTHRLTLVDVRLANEQPIISPLSNIDVLRVSWPAESYSAQGNGRHVLFFRQIRQLWSSNPGLPIVFICGAGQRSSDILKVAPQFGLRSGLSHVMGGLHGNKDDPGLLVELEFSD